MKNTYTMEEIKSVCEILDIHTNKNIFDYLRIVYLGDEYEVGNESVLYFPIYFTDYDIEDGWMNKKIDQRKDIAKIMEKNPLYTYVVEKDMLSLFDNDKYDYIVVNNMYDLIDGLFEYRRDKVDAKVVAVTGSVGKTTSVGLIEKVLSKKYNVHRIYHKRITPVLLKAHVINLLTVGTEYITLENSIYFKDHVRVLSNLLKPEVACFLQLDSSHLHKDGMDRIEDLAIYKAEIFRNAKIGFYNDEDSYIRRIKLKNNSIYYDEEKLFDTKLEELRNFMIDTKIENDVFNIEGNIVKPYLLTDLSLLQYSLAYQVGKYLNVDTSDIVNALNEYTPVENRTNKGIIFNHEVFFDGDVTTYERLKQLSYNRYANKILIIRKFGSAENTDRFEKVVELFPNFDTVYLFDDIEYLELLKNEKNAIIVSNHDFINNYNGVIFYHYSGYFRDYDIIDEKNLTDIKDDGYKIIPYKEEL